MARHGKLLFEIVAFGFVLEGHFDDAHAWTVSDESFSDSQDNLARRCLCDRKWSTLTHAVDAFAFKLLCS